MTTKIDPEKFYSLSELFKMKVFPWAGRGYMSYKNIFTKDKKAGNMLKGIERGEKNGTRIKILGKNAIIFKDSIESREYKL